MKRRNARCHDRLDAADLGRGALERGGASRDLADPRAGRTGGGLPRHAAGGSRRVLPQPEHARPDGHPDEHAAPRAAAVDAPARRPTMPPTWSRKCPRRCGTSSSACSTSRRAREVGALLAYAEDEAGGLMNPRFARLRPDMTSTRRSATCGARRASTSRRSTTPTCSTRSSTLLGVRVLPRAVRGAERTAGQRGHGDGPRDGARGHGPGGGRTADRATTTCWRSRSSTSKGA